MNNAIMAWYKATKKLIHDAYHSSCTDESLQKIIDEWNEALKTMEAACPGLEEQYEREQRIQSSFTSEQIDFICWQIGDWYIEWKSRIITDLQQGTHRLGFAKEQLKTMICGD